jgi:hypothetical protein
VTAGPNDEASPTIQVGALSSPIANEMSPSTSRVPAKRIAPRTRRRTPGGNGSADPDAAPRRTASAPSTTTEIAAVTRRELSSTWSQLAESSATSVTIAIIANRMSATTANATPGLAKCVPRSPPSKLTPVRITPAVATAARRPG